MASPPMTLQDLRSYIIAAGTLVYGGGLTARQEASSFRSGLDVVFTRTPLHAGTDDATPGYAAVLTYRHPRSLEYDVLAKGWGCARKYEALASLLDWMGDKLDMKVKRKLREYGVPERGPMSLHERFSCEGRFG